MFAKSRLRTSVQPRATTTVLLVLTTIILVGCLQLVLIGPTKWLVVFPNSLNCKNRIFDGGFTFGTCLFPASATYTGTITAIGLGDPGDRCNSTLPGTVEVTVPGAITCSCIFSGSIIPEIKFRTGC